MPLRILIDKKSPEKKQKTLLEGSNTAGVKQVYTRLNILYIYKIC